MSPDVFLFSKRGPPCTARLTTASCTCGTLATTTRKPFGSIARLTELVARGRETRAVRRRCLPVFTRAP